MDLAINTNFEEITASFDLYKDYVPKTTPESMISYVIYTSKRGVRLGVIRLGDFNPVGGIERAVRIVYGLLQKELVMTDAIVFDIRNNPGGEVPFADALAKLFSKDSLPTMARALVSENNNKLFFGPLKNTE